MEKKFKNNFQKNLSQKLADKITEILGSWTFIIFQSVFLTIWIFLNIAAWKNKWDPYPFVFLNLMLSFQAAYAAPIILMSQRRAGDRDRKKMELDFATDKKTKEEIEKLGKQLDNLEKNKLEKILRLLEEKK